MSGSSHESSRRRGPDRRDFLTAALLFAVAEAGFIAFTIRQGAAGIHLLASCALFALFFTPWPGLSIGVPRLSGTRIALLWMLALLFYDAHAAAGGAALPPSILAGALIYGWLPCALLGGKWNGDVRHGNGTHAAGEEQRWRRSHWIRLFAAVAAFWLPLAARAVHGLPMPVLARGGPQPGSTLDLTPILAVELALLLFAGVRRLGRIGYTFRLSRRDLAVALVALAAFAAVAVPLGMGIGFLRYAPRPLRAEEIALRFLGIYVFVAVPEELLFRGLLQNLIERALARREEAEEGSRVRSRSSGPASLLIASLLFGAAHLQHAPAPNYRYFLLASLAGVAYGEVWRRTGKITASALTHAAVDLIWVLLLGA